MTSQQQALISESLNALKKALKRKAYDSDSDSSIDRNTNRGNKLKKRARFVRQGQLASQSAGPALYKEAAEHAGYQRFIINENAPLLDDEGYEIESDDEQARIQEAISRNEAENPYSSIRLEQLLAPLTSVTELPSHPALSRPFASRALTELTVQGSQMMHKEYHALWKVKPLLTQLNGDRAWASCGIMIQPDDGDLFTDTPRFLNRGRPRNGAPDATANLCKAHELLYVNGAPASRTTRSLPEMNVGSHRPPDAPGRLTRKDNGRSPVLVQGESVWGDVARRDFAENQSKAPPTQSGNTAEDGKKRAGSALPHNPGNPEPVNAHSRRLERNHLTNGQAADALAKAKKTKRPANRIIELAEASGSRAFSNNSQEPSSALVNPDQAQQLQPTTQANPNDFQIHPLFLAPKSARPDRDLGLPALEADDVRRLVQLYVQKQEEICRGTRRLYEGLQYAERRRKTVLKWAKAEAHCGVNRDMSDGEDWYDKEEWGLDEDLKKGQEEEEEDQGAQQKKTRNRR